MRKLSLKTYSVYSLKKISHAHTLSLVKLTNDYLEKNKRLYAPLLSWCYLNGKHITTQDELEYHLNKLKEYDKSPSESTLLQYLQTANDVELNKYAHSFLSENMRRDENKTKDRYRRVFKKFQKELNLSTYKLCQMAEANSGNFDAFYNKNQNNRLSTKKCEMLLDKLVALK